MTSTNKNKRKATSNTPGKPYKQTSLLEFYQGSQSPSRTSNSDDDDFEDNTMNSKNSLKAPKTAAPNQNFTSKSNSHSTTKANDTNKSNKSTNLKSNTNTKSTSSSTNTTNTNTKTSTTTTQTSTSRGHEPNVEFDLKLDFDLDEVVNDSKSTKVSDINNKSTFKNNISGHKPKHNNISSKNEFQKSNNSDDNKYTKPSNYFTSKYYREEDGSGKYICPHTSEKRPKWELITSVLQERMESSGDFQEALLAYNPTYRGEWSFIGLHQCIRAMKDNEKHLFFSRTLPSIIELALALPELMADLRLPLFLPGPSSQHLSLSQRQIASLLANAFLCTFPRRNKSPKGFKHYGYNQKNHFSTNYNEGGADNMPSINFSGLFGKSGDAVVNKLRCILNYFQRVTTNHSLDGVVDFERRQVNQFPAWDESNDKLQSLHVYSEGAIEDSDVNYLRVDFSNKIIGGGILGRGCVQEEIMFCVFPELIIARLFNSMLSDSECCIFTGAEKFSNYAGYSNTFVFLGDHKDKTPRDENGRRRTQVVAMDALNFKIARDQFDQRPIHRELNKCYSAFYNYHSKTAPRPIATGNWGCGAFNGDLELKAIIQLMAAAASKRILHYFTFENSVFAANLGHIHHFLATDGISVGELWTALLIFCTEKSKRREDQAIDATSGAFNFLQLYFTNKKM